MADIYLKDYSLAKDYADNIKDEKEVQKKCKALQDKIGTGKYEIITVNFIKNDEKQLKVFGNNYKSEYSAKEYVGVLTDGENRFIIGSRFDTNDKPYFLRYLIENALADYGEVFDDTISETDDIWNYLLLVMFIERLKKALRKGTYRKYCQFQYNDSRVKGQIDIARHIRQNAGLNNGKIAYNAREYTAKNYYNILFLRAFDMMQRKYPAQVQRLMLKNRDVKLALDNLRAQNEDWNTVKIRSVLKETERKIVNNVYRDYEDLRALSRLIIRRLGINAFSGDSSTVTGVLIDMTKLWEEFLKNALLNSLGFKDQETLSILNKKRNIRPDFYNKEKRIVLDAKYKGPWSGTLQDGYWGDSNSGDEDTGVYWVDEVRKDIYQVMAYMLALGCDKGGVVFPTTNLSEGESDKILQENLSVFASDDSPDPKRYFFRVPIIIPKKDNYKEFAEEMNKQLKIKKSLPRLRFPFL